MQIPQILRFFKSISSFLLADFDVAVSEFHEMLRTSVSSDMKFPRIHKICMIWERGVVQNFRDVRDTGSMPRVALVIENWKLKTPFWAGEGRKISPSWHMSGSTFAVSMRMEHPSENTEKPRRNLAKPAHDSDTDPKK